MVTTLTPNFIPSTKTYDGTTNVNVTYILSGIINSDKVYISYKASYNDPNVGTDKTITITNIQSDNPNYVLPSTFTLNNGIINPIPHDNNYNLMNNIVKYINVLTFYNIYYKITFIKLNNNNKYGVIKIRKKNIYYSIQ